MTTASAPALAIIGMGCLFPKSGHLGAYWSLLKNGTDAISDVPPTHWDPADYFHPDPKVPDMTYARRGGFLDPYLFPPQDYGIAPNDLEATDTSQLLGLVAAEMALRDAGYGPGRSFDRTRVSVILGVTGTLELVVPLGARLGHPHWRRALKEVGIADTLVDEVVRRIGESYVGWQENSFPGLLGNVVAGRIANRLDLKGTNCVVDAACASSLSAIHLAGLELACHRCDVVVTGGVDTFNDIFMYMCFSKTPALSSTGDARPFSATADGTILGEGLGILVLKRWEDAQRDGDRIYAVIRGLGASSDGKGNAIYAPSAEGQKRCLKAAYQQAGVSPATIELVEAHGTGTKVGDATEIQALTEVYRSARPEGTWCALGSVKSQIGHTKAAAGAAGIIKAALALHHKVLPPTIKVDQPAEPLADASSPFYVNTRKRPWFPRAEHPRRAAVSAFGFGGSNFHCILEEASPEKVRVDWDGTVQIIALHGDSAIDIVESVRAWSRLMSWDDLSKRAADSRSKFDSAAPCRLTLVVSREGEPISRMVSAAIDFVQRESSSPFAASPLGIFWGRGRSPGKLAWLFSGQGSQYVGMFRDWACHFPVMFDALTMANRQFAGETSIPSIDRLSDIIYPPPAFTDVQRDRQESTLRDTRVAQPALGAVSFGALRVLQTFGVVGEMAAGHSFGELTALWAAACFSDTDFLDLARLRGRIMFECQDNGQGAMLAVHASLADVRQWLSDLRLPLTIANINAPTQVVVSGGTSAVHELKAALERRHVRATTLPVSAAFHSPSVAMAEPRFLETLQQIRVSSPAIPVYSNTTAERYPHETAAMVRLLAGQLAQPVRFMEMIQRMIGDGAATFLEVGPGNVLTRLAERIAPQTPGAEYVDCIAVDPSGGRRSGLVDLAQALARLAARGHVVRLAEWEREPAHPVMLEPSSSRFVVPIVGANYRKTSPRHSLSTPSATQGGEEESHRVLTTSRNDGGTVPARSAEVVSNPPSGLLPDQSPTPSMFVPKERMANVSQDSRPSAAATNSALGQALRLTQEGLHVFRQLQEQTAQLHRQFLQHQEAAQQALSRLIEQQQQLICASLNGSAAPFAALPTLASKASASPPMVPMTRSSESMAATTGPSETIPAIAANLSDSRTVPATSPSAVRSDSPTMVSRPLAATSSAKKDSPSGKTANRAASSIRENVQRILLEVVADKTGYPVEMLNVHMGLDADLGIDSIKRVEILSALQERLPEAPAVKPEHLGTLNTLEQIIDFLANDRTVSSAAPEQPDTVPSTSPKAESRREFIQQTLLEIVSQKTGYPVEMLQPSMGMDADLGIDSIKRVEILSALQERIPDAPTIKPEHLGTLSTLEQIVDFLIDSAVSSPVETTAGTAAGTSLVRQTLRSTPVPFERGRSAKNLPLSGTILVVGGADTLADHLTEEVRNRWGRVTRRFWDSPLESEESLAGLIFVAPAAANLDTLRVAFRWLREFRRRATMESGRFVISVSRIDGQFGLSGRFRAERPFDGGLAGLIKTAHREWPEVLCCAVDIDPGLHPSECAERIVSLTEGTPHLEMGLSADGWRTLTLVESPIGAIDSKLFDVDDVIVITGGARGVTAAVALELARRYKPHLVLMGRTILAGDEPETFRGVCDEREIKKLLAQQHPEWNLRQVGHACQQLLAVREIRDNLQRLRETGASVMYVSADVRESAVVRAELQRVRERFGSITALVHGAGIIEDRLIADKTDEQFDRVIETKVTGFLNLLDGVADDPIRAIALFSSSTGRLGRRGQCDYAAANEVLNKLARWLAAQRPGCRIASINWGPWEGGMVTPELRRVFESEGVGLIPLQAGAEFLLAEWSCSDAAIESMVFGPSLKAVPPSELQTDRSPGTSSGDKSTLDLVWTRTVSIETHPILESHVLDGRAVVPFSVHLEWLAHAAMHGQPGISFVGWDDAQVLQGIKVSGDSKVELSAVAGRPAKSEGNLHIPVELHSEAAGGRDRALSRATVVLGQRPRAEADSRPPDLLLSSNPSLWRPYDRLFHGEQLQAIERITKLTDRVIEAVVRTAPSPSHWFVEPLRTSWLADPLAIDAAFQLAVFWSMEKRGVPVLPTRFRRYRQYAPSFPRTMVRVAVEVLMASEIKLRVQIEWLDDAGNLVARLDDGEFVGDVGMANAFRRNRLVRSAPVMVS